MYYNLRRPYQNEMFHSGIKGQKWGRRRYQNYDGSLTQAGKLRYQSKEYREELEYNSRKNIYGTQTSPYKDSNQKSTSVNPDIGRYNPKASKEWNEAMGYAESSTSISPNTGTYNPNASAEYNAELAYNSRKNVYRTQTPSQWKEENAEKAKSVESFISSIKNAGTKVSKIAKKAIKTAKSFLRKIFG